jgi:hypothetical protein
MVMLRQVGAQTAPRESASYANYQTTRRALHKLVDSGLIWKGPRPGDAFAEGYISMLPAHVEQRRRVAQAEKREAALIMQAMDALGFLKAAPDPADFSDEDDYDDACGDVEFANNRKVEHGTGVRLTNEEFLKLAWMAGALNDLS